MISTPSSSSGGSSEDDHHQNNKNHSTPNNKSYEIEGVGFAVEPLRNCPHFSDPNCFNMPYQDRKALKTLFSTIMTKLEDSNTDTASAPCSVCGDRAENWFCLQCHSVCCSRYRKAHMMNHFESTHHPMVLSLADLSIYCYECDAYVENPEMTRLMLRELHFAKFGEYPGGRDASVEIGEAIERLKVDQRKIREIEEQERQANEESYRAFEILAEKIAQAEEKQIICLTGAGLSTSAGIPDFRTPGTGLYDNLQKYNLPRPTSIFELDYFHENPKPFFLLSRDFISTGYKPTRAHYFIRLLEKKGKLLRLYTQNIDGLEAKSGVSDDVLVNCHGMYDTAHCTKCRKKYTLAEVVQKIGTAEDVVVPLCDKCGGYVKPDIVLFGEDLPHRFSKCVKADLKNTASKCKLFIVIGTSLTVHPVAMLPELVKKGCTRALLNREKAGPFKQHEGYVTEIGEESNYLDLFLGGADLTIDESVDRLCKLLGWEEELEELVKQGPVDLVEKSKDEEEH
nr:unnamed protein product [Naegleria fowleri]